MVFLIPSSDFEKLISSEKMKNVLKCDVTSHTGVIWHYDNPNCQGFELIYEKCSPYTEYKQPLLSSPLHWGQKYEPISIQFYEKFYETKIMEFGCIKHQTYEYIGASPDGVNIDESNPRFGRMLEIKKIPNLNKILSPDPS